MGDSPEPSSPSSSLPPGFAKLVAIMMTGIVAVFLDAAIVNVAIDSLSSHLHTTVSTTQWAISGHVLAMGVSSRCPAR